MALKSSFPDVEFIKGSYLTEEGLRDAFVNQDIAYFYINSFSVGELFKLMITNPPTHLHVLLFSPVP